MDHGVFVQWPQLGVNGPSQKVKITAGIGDIGSTNRPCEERVAHEDMVRAVLDGNQKATSSKGCLLYTSPSPRDPL